MIADHFVGMAQSRPAEHHRHVVGTQLLDDQRGLAVVCRRQPDTVDRRAHQAVTAGGSPP